GVGRAVNVLDRVLRFDRRLDGEVFEGAGRLAVGLERVNVLDHVAFRRDDGVEAEGHALVDFRQNGEDAQPHHVVADVFEQAGVLGAADDVGVDLGGGVGLQEFGRLVLAVDRHAELVDAGALGDGEDVGRFQLPVGVVAEGLFDPGDGDLIFDVDFDAVVDHRQRRQVFVFGGGKAVGVGRRGGRHANT